jgi:hypothetical protein
LHAVAEGGGGAIRVEVRSVRLGIALLAGTVSRSSSVLGVTRLVEIEVR